MTWPVTSFSVGGHESAVRFALLRSWGMRLWRGRGRSVEQQFGASRTLMAPLLITCARSVAPVPPALLRLHYYSRSGGSTGRPTAQMVATTRYTWFAPLYEGNPTSDRLLRRHRRRNCTNGPVKNPQGGLGIHADPDHTTRARRRLADQLHRWSITGPASETVLLVAPRTRRQRRRPRPHSTRPRRLTALPGVPGRDPVQTTGSGQLLGLPNEPIGGLRATPRDPDTGRRRELRLANRIKP
jgi:hypothetical protein